MDSVEQSDDPMENPMHLDQVDPFKVEASETSEEVEKKNVKGVRTVIPKDLSKYPGFPDLTGLSHCYLCCQFSAQFCPLCSFV